MSLKIVGMALTLESSGTLLLSMTAVDTDATCMAFWAAVDKLFPVPSS